MSEKERAKTYRELKTQRENALKAQRAAQDRLAQLTQEMRKIDTHYKASLGGWVLATAKNAHKTGKMADFRTALIALKDLAPMPDRTAAWLDDQLKEIQTSEPKQPKTKKDPQKPA